MKKLLLTTTIMLVASALAVAQTIPNYVPADGLVAWYPFNGNTNDESGKANNLTGFSTSTTDRNGIADAARSFNGFSDYLSLAINQSVSPGISISIWANSTGFGTSNNQTLVNLTSANQLSMNSIFFNAQNLVANGLASPVQTPGFSVEQSAWKHYVLTSDSATNTVKLYIDGILKHTANTPLETVLRTELNIGRHHSDNWGYGWYFNGKLDDMGLWNRTLTEQEVTNLFNASLPQANCLPNYVPNNGLVAWYPFCGNANDESGNGNDGFVNGATLTSDRNYDTDRAYFFDGFLNRITVPDANILNPSSAITVSAWIRASKWGTNIYDNTIVGKDDWISIYNYGYALRSGDNGKLSFNIAKPDGKWDEAVSTSTNMATGTWYFVTGTYDGSIIKVYINGSLVGSKLSSGPLIGSYTALMIGESPEWSQFRFFNGSIDDVGIWSRALTEQEIKGLYDGTPTSIVPSMSKANMKVYPNPASDQLTVISDHSFLGSIFEIKDVLGKVWVSGKLEPHRNRIDINTLKPGIYFLSIKGNSKQVVKFIKV